MKSQMEIQRAHDILSGVLLGDVPVGLNSDSARLCCAAKDALCWALDDECAGSFAQILALIERTATAQGFDLTMVDKPRYDNPFKK